MNFGEKIIRLRKQKKLSQEELAEKLNVTRQTISKWELGQSKPDMEKLIEISKLFDIGIENLTNDNLGIENVKKSKPKKERKYLLYILILILVASTIALVIRLGLTYEEKQKQKDGFFTNVFNTITGVTDTLQNQVDNQMNNEINNQFNENISNIQNVINNMQNESNKESFNLPFKYSSGTKATIFVKSTLDSVITSNKTNGEHLITVVYKKNVTTDSEKIKNIKKSLDQWGEYEVSVDYDENGYVNKITIEDI